jgi:hypothetical protein
LRLNVSGAARRLPAVLDLVDDGLPVGDARLGLEVRVGRAAMRLRLFCNAASSP